MMERYYREKLVNMIVVSFKYDFGKCLVIGVSRVELLFFFYFMLEVVYFFVGLVIFLVVNIRL